MPATLQDPIFTDETEARKWLEARIWPNGPICPHCGNADLTSITAMHGKVHRHGLCQCNECSEQFTVTVGTVFERTKIPLTKWLAAHFLLCCSKKGMNTHQIHRMLGRISCASPCDPAISPQWAAKVESSKQMNRLSAFLTTLLESD